MANKPLSRLEARLNKVGPIDPHAEYQISILRMILQGVIGTPVQKAMLIRIVKQYTQTSNKSWYLKLAASLGAGNLMDNIYLTSYIKPPNRKKALADMSKRKKRKDRAKIRALVDLARGYDAPRLTTNMITRAGQAMRDVQNLQGVDVATAHDEVIFTARPPAPAPTPF